MIFKYSFPIVIIFTIIISCSDTKNFSLEYALLNTWSDSIKNKDYSLFKKIEAYPTSQDQFNEIYREYYPYNIAIIDVEEMDDNKSDSSGRKYMQKEIIITGDIIIRKDGKSNPFKGKIYLLKYSDNTNWLVSGRILMRSD